MPPAYPEASPRPASPPLRRQKRQGKYSHLVSVKAVMLVGPSRGSSGTRTRRTIVRIPSGRPRGLRGILLRKEVIQPLVPQRLPCYDFIPVTNRTLDVYPPCGLNRRLRVQSAPMM